MVSWGKAFGSSAICVAWCFLWIFLGGILIVIGFILPPNESSLSGIIFLIIIGLIVMGLPFNTAFYKYFPEIIEKAEVSWGEAFYASASYFGESIAWGLLFPTFSPGSIVAIIAIKGTFYQKLGQVTTGGEFEGKSAWRASGHMFGWTLLWGLVGGFIIGWGIAYTGRVITDYYSYITVTILLVIAGLYLMIMGISAAEFKELADILRFQETPWEDAYRSAIVYAALCILWLVAGGSLIFLSFFLEVPIFATEDLKFLYYWIYPTLCLAGGIFILSWGCLASYFKCFANVLERW